MGVPSAPPRRRRGAAPFPPRGHVPGAAGPPSPRQAPALNAQSAGCLSRADFGRALLDQVGIDADAAVSIARRFAEAGVDIVDVSAGQTSPEAEPVYGRMFQTPFADRIRNEVGVPTMAVGNIFEPDHVNSILVSGRADLCCLGRPHLADPNWTLRAGATLGESQLTWPVQYASGKEQLERNLAKEALLRAAG